MNVRALAYRTLRLVYKKRWIPWEEIRDVLSRLKGRDRAFFKELVWGTLRRTVYLDWVINVHLRRPDIPPSIRVALRMGLYQILFMDSVPDYASVSETVNLIQKSSFRKLVNAVLRRISREGVREPLEVHVRYSHPKWISDMLIETYGLNTAISIMANHLLPSPVVLRTNSLKITREELLEKLREDGLKAKATKYSPHGILIDYNGPLEEIDPFKMGEFSIQAQSSQIVGLILDPKPGERVLDMCASHGGKTSHIAELMEDKGEVISIDVSRERIEKLEKEIKRLDLKSVKSFVMDAREIPDVFEETFDKVLLDAPCSSLGTVRKNPDVLLRLDESGIGELSKLQRELLEAGWKVLKRGGIILYGTCTLTPQENFENAKWFAENHDVEIVDIRDSIKDLGIKGIWDGIGFTILPDREITEFYIAVFKRVGR